MILFDYWFCFLDWSRQWEKLVSPTEWRRQSSCKVMGHVGHVQKNSMQHACMRHTDPDSDSDLWQRHQRSTDVGKGPVAVLVLPLLLQPRPAVRFAVSVWKTPASKHKELVVTSCAWYRYRYMFSSCTSLKETEEPVQDCSWLVNTQLVFHL